MMEIRIDTIQKNYDAILKMVGNESYVNWDKFSKSSSDVISSIDHLNKRISTFREGQHRTFIKAMKNLKNLDLPDLINTVRAKKLPKQALRGVLSRFKLGKNDQIELVEPTQVLKENALKQMNEYIAKNQSFISELKKFQVYLDKRIQQSGFDMEMPNQPIKFNISNQLAASIASKIKIEHLPGTDLVGIKTYCQIVEGSFDLVKSQNQKLTRATRIQQRAHKKDNEKYLSILSEYLINGQNLIMEAQKMLGQKMGIPSKKLQQSEIAMMNKGLGNQMMLAQSQLRAKVKQSIRPTIEVPLKQAKQVIQYQIQLLTQKQDYLKQILGKVQRNHEDLQMIPMLLALMLNDIVYEKFGYEEEDFMKYVNEDVIIKSSEFQSLFKEMEISIIKLMKFMGLISNEDTLQALGMYQNTTKQSPIATGLMPGSNAMDLLQMQQMQQFQQMQQIQQFKQLFQAQTKKKK